VKEAAIHDNAWTLLGEKPLSSITIDDLVSGAGISRSTFYFYFESKEAVMRALAARVADEIRDVFAQARLAKGAPDVRRSIAAYLARWRTKGRVLRAWRSWSRATTLRHFWRRHRGLLDGAAARRRTAQGRGVLPAPPASKDLVRAVRDALRTGYDSVRAEPRGGTRIVNTLARR
jgi:AcrR family transcriptional regulator